MEIDKGPADPAGLGKLPDGTVIVYGDLDPNSPTLEVLKDLAIAGHPSIVTPVGSTTDELLDTPYEVITARGQRDN